MSTKSTKSINRQKLRARIVEIYGSQRQFAKALGRSEQSVTAKINHHTQLTINEIIEWSIALHIQANDIPAYFFNIKL